MYLDFSDESLTTCLDDIISGLLPHIKYEPDNFELLFSTMKSILKTEDTRGLYYIFYTIFDKYSSLAATLPKGKFHVKITKERFSNALSNNLPDLILDPNTEVNILMAEEGKSADITIPTVQQEAMGIIYNKAMSLYDVCLEKEVVYEEAMSRVIDLKDLIRSNIIMTGIGSQQVIMGTGLKRGKRNYIGPVGWLEYTQQLTRQISELDKSAEGDLVCDNLGIVTHIDSRNTELGSPLANYGIPQVDASTPMLKHRLAVFVAKENTGKTKICIHLIAKLIRSGVKVFFACGEATPEKMMNYITSSYIYQEYNMFFEDKYLYGDGYNSLAPEDKQVVDTAKARIAMSGVAISNNASYDNIESKIQNYYHQGYEAFFIDHTQSLRGRRNRQMSELVSDLALTCRELKNMLPIYICVTSQSSLEFKTLLQRGQVTDLQVSPTARSASFSQEADELFVLNDNEYLKSQGLLEWLVCKSRGDENMFRIYIRKHFNVSAFEYDAKYQGVTNIGKDMLDKLMDSIEPDETDDDTSISDDLDVVF